MSAYGIFVFLDVACISGSVFDVVRVESYFRGVSSLGSVRVVLWIVATACSVLHVDRTIILYYLSRGCHSCHAVVFLFGIFVVEEHRVVTGMGQFRGMAIN